VPNLDLFIYRHFDSLNVDLDVGDNAAEKLGIEFKGLHVVALGPPIHEGRDKTVVLRPKPGRRRCRSSSRSSAGLPSAGGEWVISAAPQSARLVAVSDSPIPGTNLLHGGVVVAAVAITSSPALSRGD